MKPILISPGQVFDRLVVIGPATSLSSHRRSLCRCVCGQTTVVRNTSLTEGNTRSCGCIRRRKPIPLRLSLAERRVLRRACAPPLVWHPWGDPDIHTTNRLIALGLLDKKPGGYYPTAVAFKEL